MTPLLSAIYEGHTECVSKLLKHVSKCFWIFPHWIKSSLGNTCILAVLKGDPAHGIVTKNVQIKSARGVGDLGSGRVLGAIGVGLYRDGGVGCHSIDLFCKTLASSCNDVQVYHIGILDVRQLDRHNLTALISCRHNETAKVLATGLSNGS